MSQLQLVRADNLLILRSGEVTQSVLDLNYPDRLASPYTKLICITMLAHPAPRNMLMLGLGGGIVSRHASKYWPHLKQDAVESDAEVIKICQRDFGISHQIRLHNYDAAAFLAKSRRKYDIIIVDAFDEHYVPAHLRSERFVNLVRNRLTDIGVAIVNTWGGHNEPEIYGAAFKKVFSLADSYNCVLLAGDEIGDRETLIAQMRQKYADLGIDEYDFDRLVTHLGSCPSPDSRYTCSGLGPEQPLESGS